MVVEDGSGVFRGHERISRFVVGAA
jgi:hypothetical protein